MLPAYAASKAAIRGLTLPLARDLSRYGIRVVCVAPGYMDTAMTQNVPKQATPDVAFPVRFGYPAEFGELCVSIIENRYLNGETIRLDGAMRVTPNL